MGLPAGTLGLREVAAYEVSRVGGFDVVPVTVLVDGPLGPGFAAGLGGASTPTRPTRWSTWCRPRRCPAEAGSPWSTGWTPTTGSVSVIHADCPPLRRLAVFDVLINNADRKGGHILASGGRVFGVDHGICFHTDPKLRTLLWGWAGTELTDAELAAVRRVRDDDPDRLGELLAEPEIEALWSRAERLLQRGRFPRPRGHWPAIPWPPF